MGSSPVARTAAAEKSWQSKANRSFRTDSRTKPPNISRWPDWVGIGGKEWPYRGNGETNAPGGDPTAVFGDKTNCRVDQGYYRDASQTREALSAVLGSDPGIVVTLTDGALCALALLPGANSCV